MKFKKTILLSFKKPTNFFKKLKNSFTNGKAKYDFKLTEANDPIAKSLHSILSAPASPLKNSTESNHHS